VLNQDEIGLRLKAMESRVAPPSTDELEPDCKFVFGESLPQQGTVTHHTHTHTHTHTLHLTHRCTHMWSLLVHVN